MKQSTHTAWIQAKIQNKRGSALTDPQAHHPIVAEWVKVLIGASVGFFLGIVGDLFKTSVNDWRDRRRMRRALYIELLNLYDSMEHLIEGYGGRQYDDDAVSKTLMTQRLDAYEHAKQNPGVFYCLNEAHSLNHAYNNMHNLKLFADKSKGTVNRSLAQLFLGYIQDCVAMGRFNRNLIKRISPDTLKKIEQDLTKRPDKG